MDGLADSVIDLSHHNSSVDFGELKASGIAGVIHKASQGLGGVDPTYGARAIQAVNAGLLWGAYRFGTGADGAQQADFFLNTLGDFSSTLLVLDFESNTAGPSMDLDEARAFVSQINARTGRWPGLYSGHYLKSLLGNSSDTILGSCWLWIAQYGPVAVIPPCWEKWTLWQYTDGGAGNGPRQTPGVGNCDRDLFNGTQQQLQQFWSSQTT